ncbi:MULTISPECIES: 4-alpha-glucanotransferase [Clostridium]|uniref:4-alpha-glucanotransferase n=1 Tax=Clostridium cibarium TaxID=2762247 RepID=A0ABR8PUI8_9CLOT|nr:MULTISPECIES: 4-alpha-glucanotransferase [Clostridium]MBD7911839.1 4-alpha-glucanotransferase [Clostridium cibarium]
MIRGAGVLMHIASLPGEFGIGTFGKEAYKFVDSIKKAGFRYWQILPLGHTGYGDSPYQCFTAFAGNPYFIDFDKLRDSGLLREEDYKSENYYDNKERINYGLVYTSKYKVLKVAYENYKKMNTLQEKVEKFKEDNKLWLDDYSTYMALKQKFNYSSWYNWDKDIKERKTEALDKYKNELKDEIEYWSFIQYLFFNQWENLKKYANSLGIKIIGDIPIYVAEDSVDTWSVPENFMLDSKTFKPKFVAGCPPDDFSPTGQLWGNLTYNWEYMKSTEYEWWISRIKQSLRLYDILRIDHFRGFKSYWQVSYGEKTAKDGSWKKGPGKDLFNVIRKKLGDIEVIAEDLGYLEKDTIKFIKETGFPGMRILQFAFGGASDNNYLPHRYINKCVAYTGTHDNDTCLGWYEKTGSRYEVKNAEEYLGLNAEEGYNWGLIRGIWSSVADIAIAQMQDFLNIGNEGRMNLPSSLGGNWSWRMKDESFDEELVNKIARFNYRYERINE